MIRMFSRMFARRMVKKWEEESKWIEDTLAGLSDVDKLQYGRQYEDRRKKMGVGYLCCVFYGCHYLYVGSYVKQVIFWLTMGGLFAWWALDFFLMFFIIDAYNRKLSMEIIDEIMNRNFDAEEALEQEVEGMDGDVEEMNAAVVDSAPVGV